MKQQKQRKAVNQATKRNATAAHLTEEAIAKRAHEIYLSRGGTHGSDLDDWLQAERELKASTTAEINKP